MKIRTVELTVTEAQAAALNEDATSGLFFDWSPETGRYHGHIDNAKLPDLPPPMILFAPPRSQAPSSKPEAVAKAVEK